MKVYEIEAEISRLERYIDHLTEEMLRIRQNIMNPIAGIQDGMPRASGNKDPMAEYAATMDELNRKCNRAMYERDRLKIRLRKRKNVKFTRDHS